MHGGWRGEDEERIKYNTQVSYLCKWADSDVIHWGGKVVIRVGGK